MSVTTYDSSFSYRQNQVARLGDKAASKGPMNAEERKRFEQSPFMQKMKEIDEMSWQKFSERDKKRRERDRSFQPKDSDFEAPKAHKYDKSVNYYKVLGIEEYATNDEVKKAYRKLSLTYHPDKTTGKSQEEKDEAATIFMEVKNAYKTLADDPTRRQYDFERDRDIVSANVHNKKPQEKGSFNATEAMKKILEKAKENQKLPAEVVRVPIQIRLEKFVFGGHKAIKRTRQVLDKFYGGFVENERTFRMDVPAGAEQPWAQEFRRQGDHHETRDPDTVKFLFTAKPHPLVDRSGSDLFVRQTVNLGEGFRRKPFVATEAPSVNGRYLLFWGRNPFLHEEGSAEEAELRVRVQGEGVDKKGSLRVTYRLGLAGPRAGTSGATSQVVGTTTASMRNSQRDFLTRFKLGPPWGFNESSDGRSTPSTAPAMSRRQERRAKQKPMRELELSPLGEAVGLATKPYCSIQFYTNLKQRTDAMFAICLSSPPCAKQRAAGDWERLKSRLLPLLQKTYFYLSPDARGILPKPLTRTSAWPERTFLTTKDEPCTPWKRLGDEAFAQGYYWEAIWLYSKRIQEMGLDEEGSEALAQEIPMGPDQVPEAAKVLSNRSACFAKVFDLTSSLSDARRAIAIAPRWARPWSRVGVAAWRIGGESKPDAIEAYKKAVELDPSRANVAALGSSVSQTEAPSSDAAHASKEEGNEAMRSGQLGLAVAVYTVAIARLPPLANDAAQATKPDEHALLRGVLFSNRSSAFIRLHNFDAAVDDGREAISAQPGLASARCQLGAALLGNSMHQEAYAEFAKALQIERDEHRKAQKGRNACLHEMVLWRSASAAARLAARFYIDLRRPRGTTRIFALSDIHFDHRENEDWVHAIDDSAFQDDVLIVAGNVADSKVAVGRGLTALKQKFRRVFYTPGNHEMSITHAEHARYPDSIAKLHAIFSECDELGVDIFPAPVSEGLTVLPLFSWYSAEFDESDPFPDPNAQYDKHCKWPMDADLQVWKYMAKLNEAFLAKPYYGTVVSFSHFLPRRGLPFEAASKKKVKAMGCEMIDEQARAIGSKMHIYGHSRSKYAQAHDGVRYVNMPLGFETDWPRDTQRKLMMVFDGKKLCTQDWLADGEPPLGYVKRVLHAAFFQMPGLKEADLRKLRAAVHRLNTSPGVQVTFDPVGSRKKDKAAFVKDVWPDLESMSLAATHGLIVVADDVAALKTVLSTAAYKTEFATLTASLSRSTVVVDLPLGVDLKHEKKPDPTMLIFPMRLSQALTEDSDEYAKLQKAADGINKLPGIEGKIAVSLMPTGFGKLAQRDLSQQLGLPEDKSAGCTHCFVVWVDAAESFKMLSQSKTYGKWRAAYESSLSKLKGGPSVMAFALPMEITTTAAAPKKEKKPKLVKR